MENIAVIKVNAFCMIKFLLAGGYLLSRRVFVTS
jgi:hypothetical protein